MVRVTVFNDTFNNISVEFSNNYCHPWEFFGFEEWGRKREECSVIPDAETLETINKNSTHTVTTVNGNKIVSCVI